MESDRKLLSECMNRAMQRIQAIGPGDLQGTLSDLDKKMLGSLYFRTTLVGFGTTIAAGMLSLRLTRNPLLSGVASAMFGGAITASDALNRFPTHFLEHIQQHPTGTTSAIVDTVVCPAVKEFEPCFSDFACRTRLEGGNERAGTLLAAYDACKARAQQLQRSFSAAAAADSRNMAAPEMDALEVHDPSQLPQPQYSAAAATQPPPEPLHAEEPAGRPANAPGDHQGPSGWDAEPVARPAKAPGLHQGPSGWDAEPVARPAYAPGLHQGPSGWDSRGAPGSSWDAVRARHRAAQEAANRTDGALPDEPAAEMFEPTRPLPAASPASSGSQGPRRKKNAYGDDILE